MARLIDVDKLIDFIDVGHLRHPGELCYSEVDVANLLLHASTVDAVEVVQSLWIPVTERLPEIGQKCLIANREIVVRGWLRPDGVCKTGVSSDEIWSKFSLYPPTHWMPLPEPPKGE